GGAESLFATIAEIFPKAPIFTSLVDWSKLPKSIDPKRVKTSFLQKIPFSKNLYKLLLPFYPLAFETFDFSSYDVVLSSTTRFAKSIITKPNTTHICYTNSTPRFLWEEKAQKEYLPFLYIILFKPALLWLKRWDRVSSSRVDVFIANSQNVARRVKKYYDAEAKVIYPFANLDFFKPAQVHNWELKSKNYLLVVSRLVKWKKIETAIRAAQNTKSNLKIVGDGPDKGRLQKLAQGQQNIEFLEKVDTNTLRDLYQNCHALVVTQEEDFGIATVEAQACGAPVIAYKRGGQSEIVQDGKTGILYKEQSPGSLSDAITASSEVKWEISACRKNSLRFSKATFVKELKKACQNISVKFTPLS
ncbi:MAG: glycosyltransferase, partial [Candidatus Curtissbacteria bacterium]|nr:glycosyltransferase [Candidatus Curtissbacteria bacterium]